MQFHYVVGYDTEQDKWFVEYDTTAYFSDGNVWHERRSEDPVWGYNGWGIPEEGTFEDALDAKCLNMLGSLVSIWPSPVVKGEL